MSLLFLWYLHTEVLRSWRNSYLFCVVTMQHLNYLNIKRLCDLLNTLASSKLLLRQWWKGSQRHGGSREPLRGIFFAGSNLLLPPNPLTHHQGQVPGSEGWASFLEANWRQEWGTQTKQRWTVWWWWSVLSSFTLSSTLSLEVQTYEAFTSHAPYGSSLGAFQIKYCSVC